MADTRRSSWLVENERDGTLLVLVPAGRVLTGDREQHFGGCPPFWAPVPAFHMALYPVTNAQYKRFVDATGHPPPRGSTTSPSVWRGGDFPPALADHPVVHVNCLDAESYCRWAGVRLPRELEWERAARGDDGRGFPWGDDWDADRCRNDLNRGLQTTCSVWDYPQGCSVWGCYQLSGNVWEWCADPYDPSAYRRHSRGDFRLPDSGATRVVRGGSWFNVAVESFSCGYRYHVRPDRCDHLYGFRVAQTV